jgi:hypothetical protein
VKRSDFYLVFESELEKSVGPTGSCKTIQVGKEEPKACDNLAELQVCLLLEKKKRKKI